MKRHLGAPQSIRSFDSARAQARSGPATGQIQFGPNSESGHTQFRANPDLAQMRIAFCEDPRNAKFIFIVGPIRSQLRLNHEPRKPNPIQILYRLISESLQIQYRVSSDSIPPQFA